MPGNADEEYGSNLRQFIQSRGIVQFEFRDTALNIFEIYGGTDLQTSSLGHLHVIHRGASYIMGMMGVFKWLRKDIIQRDRHRQSFSPKFNGLNNESYRTALHAFLERRKDPNDPGYIISPNSPDKTHLDFFTRRNNGNNTHKDKDTNDECNIGVSEVPNAQASEIFEIGWVAGTEDRYMDFIYAEWQNTKVCLRRHTHPDCKSSVAADLNVLRKVRHPNVLLLMGTTQTDDHGLIAIYEPIDCTLFNYIHEQGERVAVQGIVKCAGNLAAALKHAHMLGYIHSAISSHCVFLGSNGIVKLGGWELATDINKPRGVRSYEKRLRTEIFRWQAPELFIGQKASTATDVYGLTLLMWEMCTMNIPWSGLNVNEVEKQYVEGKRGVITDIYNFPPILNNLLVAGLQLDVAKRTLNMIKMNRFLQRLEMQYEDEEPIYIEQLTNNNEQQKFIDTSPIDISSSYNVSTVPDCHSTYKTARQYLNKSASHANHPRTDNKIKRNSSHKISPDNQKTRIKIVDEVFQSQINKSTDFTNADMIKTIKEVETRNIICDSSSTMNKLDDVTDVDIGHNNDSRLRIKKLKETLANKRENFFYGDNSLYDPTPSDNNTSKTSILSQVRSKDYEPHKPASHKTSLQPKQITSPPQLPTNITKLSHRKNQRSPYSYVPTPIRNAVIQPQILNPDSQSFFETSLWQKEKLICLSKMQRANSRDYGFRSHYHTENAEIRKNASPASDETFTVDVDPLVYDSQRTSEHFTPINDSAADITASTIPRSKSLQALKDALERATDIVRSTTPITSTSTDTSPFKSPKKFDGTIDNSNINKLGFKELNKFNSVIHGDIKCIEESTSGNTFTVISELSNECKDEQEIFHYVNDEVSQDALPSAMTSKLSSIVTHKQIQCESLTGNSNKYDFFNIVKNDGEKPMFLGRSETSRCISQNGMDREEFDRCFALFDIDDTETKEIGCFSCSRNGLIRRRSLPIELGQLSAGNYSSLRKLPIKKGGMTDATVEDLYIDDEFDETSLAPNMILMNEDTVTDDENYFPDLLESKPKHVHS